MNAHRLAQFGLPALFLYVAFAALQAHDKAQPDQFMVVPELIKAFQEVHPECKSIFCETLPPGILDRQIKTGSLVIGNLKVTLKPDIFVAGQERIDDLDREGHFEETLAYFRNRLAMMVHKDNPKNISSLEDLGRSDVRVCMPDPETEGIARKAAQAFQKAGGNRLVTLIMEEKVKNGTTFVTQIHHRQTPMRIMDKKSDAGPVWYTEAVFQQTIGNPIGLIEIPGDQNIIGMTSAGVFRDAPHKEAALAFIDFLTTEKAQRI